MFTDKMPSGGLLVSGCNSEPKYLELFSTISETTRNGEIFFYKTKPLDIVDIIAKLVNLI